MSMNTVLVGSKQVLLSEPYDPFIKHWRGLVGNEHVLRRVLAAWMRQPGMPPMTPLLVGPPGVGKNQIVYELARITGKRLWIFQGHEDVTAADHTCTVRFSDEPKRKIDYKLSDAATAAREGGILFIDEVAKERPAALASLVPLLDERGYIDATDLGERIHCHPQFRCICATNALDIALDVLPDFIASRLRPVIHVGAPPRAEIARLVVERFPRLIDNDALTARFWRLWDARFPDTLPSPRETLQAFALAMSLADQECGLPEPPASGPWTKLLPRHLEEAFEAIMASTELPS